MLKEQALCQLMSQQMRAETQRSVVRHVGRMGTRGSNMT